MNRLARSTASCSRMGFLGGLGLAVASACAVFGPTASAQQFSVGLGAGVDHGKVDCVASQACDRDSGYAKLSAGYRFANGIELQAMLFDAGHFDGGDTNPLGTPFGGRFEVGGVGLTAGYRWFLTPAWSLKGQLGIASVRTRFENRAPFTGDASKTTTQPLAGLSVGYAIGPHWQLSLDYDETRFEAHTTRGSLRLLGVAAQYAF